MLNKKTIKFIGYWTILLTILGFLIDSDPRDPSLAQNCLDFTITASIIFGLLLSCHLLIRWIFHLVGALKQVD